MKGKRTKKGGKDASKEGRNATEEDEDEEEEESKLEIDDSELEDNNNISVDDDAEDEVSVRNAFHHTRSDSFFLNSNSGDFIFIIKAE